MMKRRMDGWSETKTKNNRAAPRKHTPLFLHTPHPPLFPSQRLHFVMPPSRRGQLDPRLQKGEYWVDAAAVGLLLAVALYFLIFW